MCRTLCGLGVAGLAVLCWQAAAVGQSGPATRPAARSAGDATSRPTTLPAEEVAVWVNGYPIPEARVRRQIELTAPEEVRTHARYGNLLEQYRARIVAWMIYDRLADERAEKAGIRVDDEMMREFAENELEAYLSDNGLTRDEFNEMLQEEQGQTLDEFLEGRVASERRRHDLQQRRLFELLFPEELRVSDEDITRYYEQKRAERYVRPTRVRASHIMFLTEGKSEEEKAALKRKAEQVLAEARRPDADFVALVKKYSEAPTKQRDGDLGFFERRGSQPEPLAEAAFSLKIGAVDGVIETWSGYHIINVTDREEGRDIPLERAKRGIRMYLEDRKYQLSRRLHLPEWEAEATIVYPPGKKPIEFHEMPLPDEHQQPTTRPQRPPARPRPTDGEGAAG